jgi:hypothetical protein
MFPGDPDHGRPRDRIRQPASARRTIGMATEHPLRRSDLRRPDVRWLDVAGVASTGPAGTKMASARVSLGDERVGRAAAAANIRSAGGRKEHSAVDDGCLD